MAYEYVISFELKKDSTYNARYESLVAQIDKTSPGNAWDETTSFALVSSNELIEALADRLYYKSEILDAKDILLVIDHQRNVAIGRGPIKYPALLKSHFKTCVLK
jgi:hypothetical protein